MSDRSHKTLRGRLAERIHEATSQFDEAHMGLQLAHTKRNKVAAAYNHAKYLKAADGDDAVVGGLH